MGDCRILPGYNLDLALQRLGREEFLEDVLRSDYGT